VAEPGQPAVTWRRSTRSNGNGGGNCVEVAFLAGAVAVRDSKDPGGAVLCFGGGAWSAFVRAVERLKDTG
jgi:hypothetical protein